MGTFKTVIEELTCESLTDHAYISIVQYNKVQTPSVSSIHKVVN